MGLGGLVMLRSLQLFSCEITDAGAAAIGAAAATLPCLRCFLWVLMRVCRKLELAFNRISHAGFRLVSQIHVHKHTILTHPTQDTSARTNHNDPWHLLQYLFYEVLE